MRTTNNKTITSQQLRVLHATFHAIGMNDEARHACVYAFTDGRTQSTKELTFEEARQLISRLKEEDTNYQEMMRREAKNLLRSIYFLSMQVSFLNKGFPSDTQEDFEMNKAKLNVWARKYSSCHKNITSMSVAELQEVKKQLEAIAHKEDDGEN